MQTIVTKNEARPESPVHTTLILNKEDMAIAKQREVSTGIRDLPTDMVSIYDFTYEIKEALKKATNVIYISPDGQIKVLKHRHKVLQ